METTCPTRNQDEYSGIFKKLKLVQLFYAAPVSAKQHWWQQLEVAAALVAAAPAQALAAALLQSYQPIVWAAETDTELQ